MSEEMEKDMAGMDEKPDAAEMAEAGNKAHWYVVHTYSGYENKVKANLEKTIEQTS